MRPRLPGRELVLGGAMPTGDDKPTRLVLAPGKSANFSLAYWSATDESCPAGTVWHRLSFTDGLTWTTSHRQLNVCNKGIVRLGPLHTPVY